MNIYFLSEEVTYASIFGLRAVRKGGFSKGGFSNHDMIIAHRLLNLPSLNPLCELPRVRRRPPASPPFTSAPEIRFDRLMNFNRSERA